MHTSQTSNYYIHIVSLHTSSQLHSTRTSTQDWNLLTSSPSSFLIDAHQTTSSFLMDSTANSPPTSSTCGCCEFIHIIYTLTFPVLFSFPRAGSMSMLTVWRCAGRLYLQAATSQSLVWWVHTHTDTHTRTQYHWRLQILLCNFPVLSSSPHAGLDAKEPRPTATGYYFSMPGVVSRIHTLHAVV